MHTLASALVSILIFHDAMATAELVSGMDKYHEDFVLDFCDFFGAQYLELLVSDPILARGKLKRSLLNTTSVYTTVQSSAR